MTPTTVRTESGPAAITPGALPLVAVEISILPLLRETSHSSSPSSAAAVPLSTSSRTAWTIPAAEIRPLLEQLAKSRASLSLVIKSVPDVRGQIAIPWRNDADQTIRSGILLVTNAEPTATNFHEGVQFSDLSLAFDRDGALSDVLLRASFASAPLQENPHAATPAPPTVPAPALKAPGRDAAPALPDAAPQVSTLESYVLKLADFAQRLANIEGVTVDGAADRLIVGREIHEYAWLTNIPGLRDALRRHAGNIVQMSVDGLVLGTPNLEAFIGFKHDNTWRNIGARPKYPVALRVADDFADVRVGLRLVGHGSLDGLRIKFRGFQELEAGSRIALRRTGEDPHPTARLRLALIGDPFTVENFEGVADTILIKPHNWRALLKLHPPDFLFVESAWLGNDGAWANRIVNNVEELEALTRWCRTAGVPTIFWNKEDPVHFHRFLKAAKLFDLVYTTCVESIPNYEKEGIRARLLPFSVNIATYNPIGSGRARERHGVFAGSYYGQKYPERTADMEAMLDLMMRYGLRIFDRNAGSTGEEYQFPPRFRPYIVGSADARQLDREYKRARVAINVNTVKTSRSMVARRVVELAITGTPIISNSSPALNEMFGDGLIANDDPAVIAREIEQLFEDDDHWRGRRRTLMRAALLQHTVQDRLETILRDLEAPAPGLRDQVALFGHNAAALEFSETRFRHARVLESAELGVPIARLMPTGVTWAALALNDARWTDVLLREYVRHQDYAQADVLGETQDAESFRYGGGLRNSLLLVRCKALQESDLSLADFETGDLADRFRALGLKTFGVEILSEAPVAAASVPAAASTRAQAISGWWPDAHVLILRETSPGEVEGVLAGEGHAYARLGGRHKFDLPPETSFVSPQDFPKGFALNFMFTPRVGIFDAALHVSFYRNGERLARRLVTQNTSAFVRAPEGWTHVSLAVRVKGQGEFAFAAQLHDGLRTAGEFLTWTLGPLLNARQAWLCLSSVYPRQDNLYRNAFVHTRVKSYIGAGRHVAVVSMEGDETVLSTYEFEGVRVFAGAGAALADVLKVYSWDRVACHIVSRKMLEILDAHAPGIRKIVWVHAIEAERWHRRSFDIDVRAPDLEARLRRAIAESEERNGGVRLVYERSGRGARDCRVIFVSQWFRDYIGCIDVRPVPLDCRVIHNPIDVALFSFRQKQAEDRFRWLSVRPFVSLKYANDLTVAAIVLLSQEEWFDKVSVTLVGRGPLFEATVAPLRGFSNVTLENRFLTQAQIAEYHGAHGVFLAPTRSDSQGVSLGEAMSSGLVPVSNDCQAISEFVPPEWGLLAPASDAAGIAVILKRLVEHPALYCELSAKASRHIQGKCASAKIRAEEIAALTDP